VTEALSVIENLDRMGVKFPAFIRDALKKQEEKE
jgi:phage-related holin